MKKTALIGWVNMKCIKVLGIIFLLFSCASERVTIDKVFVFSPEKFALVSAKFALLMELLCRWMRLSLMKLL